MKNDRTTKRSLFERAIFYSTFIVLLSSCASLPELPWAGVARDASAGFYETARLEYRLDAGKLGQPLDVVRVDGRRVGYEQIASSPLPEQSVGTLVIQHPHPAGRAGLARVTFSLDSSRADTAQATGLNPFKSSGPPAAVTGHHEEIHEVWALDLPRAEADRYFQLLSTTNFYNAAAKEAGAAELAVTINGKELRKNWEQVGELNQLVVRVRREGQLVAYLRPASLAGTGTRTIASTQAYREMLAKIGGPDGPTGTAEQSPGGENSPRMAQLPYGAR